MQIPSIQPPPFCVPPKGQVSTASCNLRVKDFPQVSDFFSLNSDKEQMEMWPLVSSTQVSSGFSNVAKSSGDSLQGEVIYLNSPSQLINESKDFAPETQSQTIIYHPDMALSSSRGDLPSFSSIHPSECSVTSLVSMDQQLQWELDIQAYGNLFSPTSHLFSPLKDVRKKVGNIPYDGNNAPNGVQEGKNTHPYFISHSRGSGGDSTTYNACGTLPKACSSFDQAMCSDPLLEQIGNSPMDSLSDQVSQPLDISFSSGIGRAQSRTLFQGILMKRVPSLSLACNSSVENQSMSSTGLLVDGNMQSMSSNLTRNTDLCDRLLNFKHDKGIQFWDDPLLTCVPALDVTSLLEPDQKYPETCSDGLLDSVVAKMRSTSAVHDSDDILSKSTLSQANSMPTCSSPVQCETYPPLTGNVPSDLNAGERSNPSQDNMSAISQVISGAEVANSTTTGVSVFGKMVSDERLKVNKRRERPGESTRPRPKDRQQIQDRVRELREIVPNGEKCSIDALLDRTIKHMMFLQSVAKHVDKIKHGTEPESAAGATWGFGLGHDSPVSPIIVETLSQPGQMLIEMQCKEQGFFLEIAEVIRGFNLTILKGIMEAQNGKILAHFVVEASWHVTRMDIFMSLAQLLDQTTYNSLSPCNR